MDTAQPKYDTIDNAVLTTGLVSFAVSLCVPLTSTRTAKLVR